MGKEGHLGKYQYSKLVNEVSLQSFKILRFYGTSDTFDTTGIQHG